MGGGRLKGIENAASIFTYGDAHWNQECSFIFTDGGVCWNQEGMQIRKNPASIFRQRGPVGIKNVTSFLPAKKQA